MKIPYTSKAKAARMNRNPVQAANLFLALKRFVYEALFGMPCDSTCKYIAKAYMISYIQQKSVEFYYVLQATSST